jgi:lipopolysaccharide biosynthesis glycosyltransferase
MESSDKIVVVGMASHSYLPGALTTFSSILRSSSSRKNIEFLLFSDDFTNEDEEKLNEVCRRSGTHYPVVIHKPDMGVIKKYCVPYKGSYLTSVRLFLCSFLECDWIVYVDTDTLWYRDIADLWGKRSADVPIYWSLDIKNTANSQLKEKESWSPGFKVEKYGSGGVILMNLAYLRRDRVVDRVKSFIDRYGCPFYADQDILNCLYNKESVIIDSNWNCMVPNRTACESVVLHCVGIGGMFSGPMRGWNAFNGLWYEYYSRFILGSRRSPCGFLRRFWWHLYGFFYPCDALLRLLTKPFASHRAEQLSGMQFRAWVYAHRKWGFGR